jgi:hypothetical protein
MPIRLASAFVTDLRGLPPEVAGEVARAVGALCGRVRGKGLACLRVRDHVLHYMVEGGTVRLLRIRPESEEEPPPPASSPCQAPPGYWGEDPAVGPMRSVLDGPDVTADRPEDLMRLFETLGVETE